MNDRSESVAWFEPFETGRSTIEMTLISQEPETLSIGREWDSKSQWMSPDPNNAQSL